MCMVVVPLAITVFFTSLMGVGQPMNMPIGIVDNDNTTTSRKLTRMIDGFQSSEVVAHYPDAESARKAMQRNEIYGFILFPHHMTEDMISMRQPKMSIYYSNTALLAGSLLYKEMRVLCTLGSAGVGQATLRAKGATDQQAMAFLMPIKVDAHAVGNPWVNYNYYLSAMLVPACLLLFIVLLTAYSIGSEIKFGTREEWLEMAGGNIWKALLGKLLPQTCIFVAVIFLSVAYMYGVLHFPIAGGYWRMLLLSVLAVIASQGLSVFIFGLLPSMRMSMSICSLWGVLSFSMVGTAFPVFAMDAPLQALSQLFPMRHYYLIYQLCVFNDYPLSNVYVNILALLAFAILPVFVIRRIHRAVREYEYEP